MSAWKVDRHFMRGAARFGRGAFTEVSALSDVSSQLDGLWAKLDAPVMRLNGLHTPTPYSPALEAAVVPNTQTILQSIRDLLAE